MKNLKDIVSERLHITKQTSIYNYFPKTKDELREILKERLAKDKNANLNDIDVSKITDMSVLFWGLNAHDIDISNWDVSKVTNMSGMFNSCTQFNSDLSNWDVSKVNRMRYMFFDCGKFKGKGLDKWNPVNFTDMHEMFYKSPLENNPPEWYKNN